MNDFEVSTNPTLQQCARHAALFTSRDDDSGVRGCGRCHLDLRRQAYADPQPAASRTTRERAMERKRFRSRLRHAAWHRLIEDRTGLPAHEAISIYHGACLDLLRAVP